MLGHQLRVEQLVFWRNRSSVFFTFVFPLLLLVIFANAGGGLHSRRILIPGIAALAIVSTCFQGMAIGLAMHRDQGVLKRIIATPLPLTTLVTAKMLSAAFVAILEIVIVLVAGATVYGIGWPAHVPLFVLTVVVGVLSFSALGIALTAIIPSGESAPAITNAAYLPMMLLSNVFYDAGNSPKVVEVIAKVLPLWHLATATSNTTRRRGSSRSSRTARTRGSRSRRSARAGR